MKIDALRRNKHIDKFGFASFAHWPASNKHNLVIICDNSEVLRGKAGIRL